MTPSDHAKTLRELTMTFVGFAIPDDLRKLSDAADELERVGAIVSRLPVTADGVTVVPGMTIYKYMGRYPNGQPFVADWTVDVLDKVGNVTPAEYPTEWGQPSDCYSTYEGALDAALARRRDGEGTKGGAQ